MTADTFADTCGGSKKNVLGEYSRGRTRTADPGIMSALADPSLYRFCKVTPRARPAAVPVPRTVSARHVLTILLTPVI